VKHHHVTPLEAFVGGALVGRGFRREPDAQVFNSNPPPTAAARDEMNEPLHMNRNSQATRVLEGLRRQHEQLQQSWTSINSRVQAANAAPDPEPSFWNLFAGRSQRPRATLRELPRPKQIDLPTREVLIAQLDAEAIGTLGELAAFQKRLEQDLFAAEFKELGRINFDLADFAEALHKLLVEEAERLASSVKALNAERARVNSMRSFLAAKVRSVPLRRIRVPSKTEVLQRLQAAQPVYQTDLFVSRRVLFEELLSAYAGDPDLEAISVWREMLLRR
jgi:hypothetical protein